MAILVISIGAIVCLIVFIMIILILRNSLDKKNFLATPTIPVEKVMLTSYASSIINAHADEVFKVLLNYKEYSNWSTFSGHKWDDIAEDGMPVVGSKGTFQLRLEGFSTRTFPAKLTMLDHESRTIAGRTTGYPQWLLSTERVQHVVPIKGRKEMCEYRTWQTVQGVASYFLILFAREELAESVRATAKNLKTFVENSK